MDKNKVLENMEETRDLLNKIKELWKDGYEGSFDLLQAIEDDLSELNFDINIMEKEINQDEEIEEDPYAERADREYELEVDRILGL